jgi:hypothetical protein
LERREFGLGAKLVEELLGREVPREQPQERRLVPPQLLIIERRRVQRDLIAIVVDGGGGGEVVVAVVVGFRGGTAEWVLIEGGRGCIYRALGRALRRGEVANDRSDAAKVCAQPLGVRLRSDGLAQPCAHDTTRHTTRTARE